MDICNLKTHWSKQKIKPFFAYYFVTLQHVLTLYNSFENGTDGASFSYSGHSVYKEDCVSACNIRQI